MKKKINFKRIGAVLMTAIMSLSMGMTALADEPQAGALAAAAGKTGTLTIQGIKGTNEGDIDIPKDGAEYAIYPVLTFQDAQQLSGGGYVYTNITANDKFKSIIDGKAANGKTGIEVVSGYPDQAGNNVPSSLIAQFAAELAAVADKLVPAADFTIGTTSAVTLPYGYYLVVETAAPENSVGVKSAPMLVAIPQIQGNTFKDDVTVTVKSSSADIDKEIVVDENGNTADLNNGAVGDSVNYKVTSDIPMYGAGVTDFHYVINDKLSKGLTYQAESMKISLYLNDASVAILLGGDADVLGNVVSVANDNGDTDITIKINNELLKKVSGKEIYKYAEDGKAQFVLEYSAKINAVAVQGNGGNKNSVNLEYKATHTTENKVVTTYTTSLLLIKEEQNSAGTATGTPLKGAKFKLSKKDGTGNYVELKKTDGSLLEFETDDNGKLTFPGLSEGEYELEETLAPSGYNLDSTKRHFKLIFDTSAKTWSAEGEQDIITLIPLKEGPEGNFQTTITNVKGMTLPGTGGMGTTIFKTVGGAVILLACAMLLIYYKKSKKNTQQ